MSNGGFVVLRLRPESSSTSPETACVQPSEASNGGSHLTLRERSLPWLRENWQIVCLVLISLAMHLGVVGWADKLIYDEHYWVPEANSIIHQRLVQWPQYPALGKLFIAAGISVFGDNPWGWRIPSVIFGTITIVLVYLLGRKLAGKRTAILAAFLLVFENLTFVMSGLAMLDISSVAFMLLSFLLYLDNKYALSGTALALSILCKPSGVLAVFVVLGYWFLTRQKRGLRNLGSFVAAALLAFFLLMPATDFMATGQWLDPFGRIAEMLAGQTSLKLSQMTPEVIRAVHAHPPWEWITFSASMLPEPTTLRHTMIITPPLLVLIIPSMVYMLYESIRNKRMFARFVLMWFGATYLLWIPIELLTDRPMYIYYFVPTVGAVCLAVGFGVQRAWRRFSRATYGLFAYVARFLLVLYVILYVLAFVLCSPLAAGLAAVSTQTS